MKRGPRAIEEVLAEVMARRGYARVHGAETCNEAWRRAAGPLTAKYTRPGLLRRGTLEIVVANSTLIQELGFQKDALLESLSKLAPEAGIENLRFRVGSIEQ
ncbi:MAG: DUF721 domain-containing protein [Pirellulales bacterium]|nr:DUF721 domain-containing protein [Pirellulales bacterium]